MKIDDTRRNAFAKPRGPPICALLRVLPDGVTVTGTRAGPAALELAHHALAPAAQLPVRALISGAPLLTDLTLGPGSVIHDHLV